MKSTNVRLFCVVLMLALVLAGCVGFAPLSSTLSTVNGDASGGNTAMRNGNSPGMDLDAAIKEGAAQMEAKIPQGTMIALVSVASSSAQLSEYVISRLEAALVSGGKLVVVDRANLDKVRTEQGFQLSGEVDDESAKRIGGLLGAGAIVTGSFTNLGDVYGLALKAINMETATVAVSYPADIAVSTRIETLLSSGGGAASGVSPGGAAQAAAPAYKIGDSGPAGGIVFYDKGNNSGGWRYLEAASYDLEKAVWGDAIGETKDTIGSGKQNTQNIRGRAAMLCLQHDEGGQRDWYLPSKDELDLMFMNLKIKGLGNFSDSVYWSSSLTGYGVLVSAHNFSDGTVSSERMNGPPYTVRPIRQF